MKRLLLIATIFLLVSCKKDITSLNVDTKEPTKVPAEALFANAVKNLADRLSSTSVNSNIFRLIAQQWTQTTYTDESRYDLVTRKIPDGLFAVLYRDVLKNLEEAKTIVANDASKSSALKASQTAIADIMQVYAYHVLVNTFGDVPYDEALNYANFTPKYTSAQEIELDLLKRLTDDIAVLATTTSTGYGSSDLIYSGNTSAWIKFANSLKLKLAMLLVDVPALSVQVQTYVNDAVNGGVFTSNTHNALLKYMGTTPNTNPLWVDLEQSERTDFVASKTIVDIMNGLDDPRRPLYFTQVSSTYKGGVNGEPNSYSSFSAPSNLLRDPTVPCVFLDYSEVNFLLAEAAARGGFTVAGTAQDHYNAGIEASIAYWYVLASAAGTPNTTPTDATTAATTYAAQSSVDYNNSASGATYKQKIGQQKYLALYNRGFDAWTEWRRLKFPDLPPASGATAVPRRFTYPIKEQNLNGANYSAAAAHIGGDNMATRLFWDK